MVCSEYFPSIFSPPYRQTVLRSIKRRGSSPYLLHNGFLPLFSIQRITQRKKQDDSHLEQLGRISLINVCQLSPSTVNDQCKFIHKMMKTSRQSIHQPSLHDKSTTSAGGARSNLYARRSILGTVPPTLYNVPISLCRSGSLTFSFELECSVFHYSQRMSLCMYYTAQRRHFLQYLMQKLSGPSPHFKGSEGARAPPGLPQFQHLWAQHNVCLVIGSTDTDIVITSPPKIHIDLMLPAKAREYVLPALVSVSVSL